MTKPPSLCKPYLEQYPLSRGQRALWFLSQLNPESGAYNINLAWTIRTRLDLAAFRGCLQQLAERHAIFRTTFGSEQGSPYQVVHDSMPVSFEKVEAQKLDDEDFAALLDEESNQLFLLDEDPPIRWKFFQRGPDEYVLLMNLHHIGFDLPSVITLMGEVRTLYRAAKGGAPVQLPALKQSFKAYVQDEDSFLESEKGQQQFAFWQKELAGELPVINLPTDFSRPPRPSFNGACIPFEMSSTLVEQCGAIAQKVGVSAHAFYLAAFQSLLKRYSDQTTILTGIPTTARPDSFAGVLGYFVSPVVIRSHIGANAEFSSFLEQTAATKKAALQHHEYPFSVLVEHLLPNRDVAYSPLFQVAFVYEDMNHFNKQETPLVSLNDSGKELWDMGIVQWERVLIKSTLDQFDLTMKVAHLQGKYYGILEYNTDLFARETAARMVGHYQTLLKGVVADPTCKISDLPLLQEDERLRLIETWNQTNKGYPTHESLHQLFEAQVVKTPDDVVAVFRDQDMTYAQLNEQANQLARYLRKAGIGPDTFVGVCITRNLDLVVAIYSILKAGGAYVPLDPNYPPDRLAFMIEDTRTPVLLTQECLLTQLPEHNAQVICMDTNWQTIAAEDKGNLENITTPDHLAYTLFTSGSTGRPKGVMIKHLNGVAFFYCACDLFPPEELDGVLFSTSINFDIHVFELFIAPGCGGKFILVENALEVIAMERASEVTLINTVPSVMIELTKANAVPASVRVVNLIGEPLTNTLVQRIYANKNVEKVYNLYGPSEDTVYSTWYLTQRGEDELVLIGRPIPNSQVYILDGNGYLTPQGVPGELLLAGPGLSRGYLRRPETTCKTFIANPFSPDPGERMYKTGDLVRYRQDGEIEFLGRLDHQVKIRGFRIELGEIEARLLKHPAVKEALVMAREDKPGDKQLVAYLVTSEQVDNEALCEHINEKLPDYMIPSAFVELDEFPLTPNGKTDRKALPSPDADIPEEVAAETVPRSQLERTIADVWKEVLKLEQISAKANFFELGGHSLLAAVVQAKLKNALGREILSTDIFQYPTISALASYFSGEEQPENERTPRKQEVTASGEIAVIGLSGRFPGASDYHRFWENLTKGVVSIHNFSDEELLQEGIDPEEFNHPDYVRARGLVDDPEYFDARFFNYTPKQAEIIDPQQRFFLEGAWQALEDACYDPNSYDGRIGVYSTANISTYLLFNLSGKRDYFLNMKNFQAGMANIPDTLPTRVSFKLNLTGPSFQVQTACSSSLTAIHLACKGLLNGECEMALAGGVSIHSKQRRGYLWEEGGILSAQGKVSTFDAEADGTLFGGGQGIVVLKRMSEAEADRDRILAVVKGSAFNNDGSQKVGFTAVSVVGQTEVIVAAQTVAGVEPESITYVETHGTGTKMGDPIEVAALSKAFRRGTAKKRICALGSVKPNIGHLDAAAGVANFIKATLCLYHKQLPPSVHYKEANPAIDFEASPFYVNNRLTDWNPAGGIPRRCGTSALGVGGTNVHAILEEAPECTPSSPPRPWLILPLSAKTSTALNSMATNLKEHLKAHSEQKLADVAYSLQVGRAAFERRCFFVVPDREAALEALASKLTAGIPKARKPVFMFSGQGSQYLNMARGLYENEPVFWHNMDQCSEYLQPHLGEDLRKLLYPDLEPGDEDGRTAASERLKQTDIAQPALFTVEYATAKLWMSWGIQPEAMIGHSIGEYVAACLAGVFTLEEALEIVVNRGRLMQNQPAGDMMAVPLTEAELEPLLSEGLGIAALNEFSRCVVSGPKQQIDILETVLKEREVSVSRLITSHAFHSVMMDEILEPFTQLMREVDLKPPTIPYISNLTGTWITKEQATDPNYYAKHLRGAVRFAQGIAQLLEEPDHYFIEVGPGRTLVSFTKRQLNRESSQQAFSSIRHPKQQDNDMAYLLTTVGQLWQGGVEIDWAAFSASEKRSKLALPTYPFERQRFWIEALDDQVGQARHKKGRKEAVADWFYTPSWRQTPLPLSEITDIREDACWLLFDEQCGLGTALGNQLKKAGYLVITVTAASNYKRVTDHDYQLNPADRAGYLQLITAILSLQLKPFNITHLWNVTRGQPDQDHLENIMAAQERAFYSPLYLAQALNEAGLTDPMRIQFVTNFMHGIEGSDTIDPAKATLLGPCKVLPTECPHITCQSIDIVLPPSEITDEHPLVLRLKRELEAEPDHAVVALRGHHRWYQAFASVPISAEVKPLLKERGTYFITGGLGGIGLAVAEYLAETKKANLVLLGRSAFPERGQWDNYLSTADDRTAEKIRRLVKMEAIGAKIRIAQADVANPAHLEKAVHAAQSEYGRVDGVFHCAGVPGSGLMQLKDRETAARVLEPKIRGTHLLWGLFRKHKPDFFAMCSSLYTVAGHVGQVDYCAANAYLDAFAHHHSLTGSTNVVAINWDAWREAGMAVETETSAQLRQKREQELLLAMTNREGSEAFYRIVSNPTLAQVIVTPVELETRPQNIHELARQEGASECDESQTTYSRPELESSYEAPTTKTQKMIAEVVQEKLGYDQIGAQDNFYDLGLDSLIATTISAQLQKIFNLKLSARIILDDASIEAVAKHIDAKQKVTQVTKPLETEAADEREDFSL